MTVVKVVEIICEGKSIEDAINAGVAEASKTIHDIKHVDIEHVHANIENNKVVSYRVITKVSFIVKH